MTTTSKISVGTQITGYSISIDKLDITLNNNEIILLTQALLAKCFNVNLADIMPTTEQRDYVTKLLMIDMLRAGN